MKQEMLINVRQPEECRIAVVENNVLEELYVERTNQDNYVGNIYKGVIVNLEPSIQAAFIDFGVGRNGFLHISDVEPSYFKQAAGWNNRHETEEPEVDRRPNSRSSVPDDYYGNRPRLKPPIQDVFKRGDEVIVQVIKEGIGNKGPTLSTYISIPGRYLVLMPSLGRVGVSRKIEDEGIRRKLRDVMYELNPPKGLGFIVRTAGADRTRSELALDLAYLMRLWKVIVRRLKKMPAPIDIYEESDMIIRTIRDIYTSDIDTITIDEPKAFERAKEFLELVMPRYSDRVRLYDGREPIFHKFGLDDEIAKISQRRVPLREGGSIVIDQTEALVAIDVNSGNFRAEGDAEETSYRMNLNAAKEIARQLRLRDLMQSKWFFTCRFSPSPPYAFCNGTASMRSPFTFSGITSQPPRSMTSVPFSPTNPSP
ncbi:MAG: Rne/Rng family ribonuclease [Planctomycetaceae bacterium]|jgi:ribonuclease E|nr:Rne/Rng family ribonuclease [Planctomycetaceae bacterium]